MEWIGKADIEKTLAVLFTLGISQVKMCWVIRGQTKDLTRVRKEEVSFKNISPHTQVIVGN